jgi:predicted DNA-binding transcriptional regulator YafY
MAARAQLDRRNEQVGRILRLIETLARSRMGMTAPEIRRELEYGSRRTFFRDLSALLEAGISIQRQRGQRARVVRYSLPPVYSFLRSGFTEEEFFSLIFARNALRPLEGSPIWEGLTSALEKVERTVSPDVQERYVHAGDFFVAGFTGRPRYKGCAAQIRDLKEAILSDRVAEVTYQKEGGPLDRHTFHPFSMLWVDGFLYVHGHSRERRDRRVFRVDRIQRVRLLAERFRRPADVAPGTYDPDDFFRHAFRTFHDPHVVDVTLEFSPSTARFVRERMVHPSQTLEPLRGGAARLTLRVPISPELISWVLSFGHGAKVLEPAGLARSIRLEFEAARARYD